MDTGENSAERSRTTLLCFTISVIASQVVGLTLIAITATWMTYFRGGFAWQSNPEKEFNYHPLFMITGMVFLYGDAILVYRIIRRPELRTLSKIIHFGIHLGVLVFASVGLKTVFDSHNLAKPVPIPNMYSLHSWLGITTVVLFGLQWLIGLVAFLLPGLPLSVRSRYKPVHVFMGIAIFLFAIATALMGITEKNLFRIADYKKKDEEGILSNTLGLLLVLFGLCIVFIVTNDSFKRHPQPEEESLIHAP